MSTLKHFRVDFIVAAVVLVIAFFYDGVDAVSLTAILIVLEIVFSFDNAAVNAKYLEKMNEFWQKMFLTVGVLVAVFGMRLIFPFVIVCLSGQISPVQAVHLALERGDHNTPGTYGYILDQAHPAIAAFGGMFLLLLFLDFMFDGDKEVHWLGPIERALQRIGALDMLGVIVAGIGLLVAAEFLTTGGEKATVLFSGVLGIVLYLAVNGLSSVMEDQEAAKDEQLEQQTNARGTILLAGKAALSLFFFLEVLDATFSFDGVIGAFAITPDPIIIAMGLGVGALAVRSLTVYLVRNGTLAEYRYLENGAHWAIGALAVMLILTIKFHLGEVVIGGTGIAFILAAWLTSVRENKKRDDHDQHPTESIDQTPASAVNGATNQ
ncbi:DUF475 domain-containing protein [Allobranchiibius sp. GilTou73]|uniref:DUF475 domain-containing protein n=1 Tax=Allobranchiibius sp. GilTou73 TaxID=2904523 RepID=UPI001F36B44A|nr:DUF475 domain-containing protein [Allobranchiibius sp. GilTou73]UIJ35424.1 DUF475 domain-containing protein [Allobranchiibius sp. GilTou73]